MHRTLFKWPPKTNSIQDPNLYLVGRPCGPRPNVRIGGAKIAISLNRDSAAKVNSIVLNAAG